MLRQVKDTAGQRRLQYLFPGILAQIPTYNRVFFLQLRSEQRVNFRHLPMIQSGESNNYVVYQAYWSSVSESLIQIKKNSFGPIRSEAEIDAEVRKGFPAEHDP